MKIIGSSFDKNFYMSLVRDHASKRLTDEASEGLASFREKRDANWYSRKGWCVEKKDLVLKYTTFLL